MSNETPRPKFIKPSDLPSPLTPDLASNLAPEDLAPKDLLPAEGPPDAALPLVAPVAPAEIETLPVAWDSLGLSPEMLDLIARAGFAHPSPIQVQAIPPAIEGKSLVASARTGTGKTLAFLAPMIERFAGRSGTFGLVLSPTREIAQQTQAALEVFGKPRGITSAVLIGGIDLKIDARALQTYPHILVATPGRLCDHIERGNVWLDYIEIVVLDEADQMLNMGFSDQLNRIMSAVSETTQKLLFSATIPPEVDRIARKFMKDPVRIQIGQAVSATPTVTQKFIYVEEDDKFSKLRSLLQEEKGSIIIFTRSKDTASRLWLTLHSRGVTDVVTIHSNLQQKHREQSLADFKSGKSRILVATDVAGRGIHVENVALVINYELPIEAEEYVHRVGRTGRVQATGLATSMVSPRDRSKLSDLEKIIGRPIKVENAPTGFWPAAPGSTRPAPRSGPSRGGGGRRPTRR